MLSERKLAQIKEVLEKGTIGQIRVKLMEIGLMAFYSCYLYYDDDKKMVAHLDPATRTMEFYELKATIKCTNSMPVLDNYIPDMQQAKVVK